ERLVEAVEFFAQAIHWSDKVNAYLEKNPKYRKNW
ncbi:MAG: hypothetical protein RIR17_1326, partial [Planctomycetota bacterium]